LKRFQGKIIVVKFGGNAMVDDALQKSFAEDMAYLRWIGLRPVVVHGGGPQITARLAELGLPSDFKGGLRVTTKETIEVVRDVLRTNISARLAGLIEFAGAKTTVLSGEDRNLFMAEKVLVEVDGEPVDIGLVGEVVSVDPTAVLEALDAGKVPVISTVAPSTTDGLLNINADQAASSLAIALGAEKLVVLTDVPGLYADWPNRESLLSEVTIDDLRELLPRLQSGMIPKMKACLQAVEQGVPSAHIIDGRTPHSILLEIFTKSGYGTMVNP
jgi:acetylglutamate kinase